MYRVTLTSEQVAELARRCHDPATKPRTRDRLEMVRLSHAGWSVPRIAGHFRITESRARHWVKAFLSGGFDALESKPSPGPPRKLTDEIIAALREAVGQDGRTWTAPQVMDWLREHHGLTVNRSWLCEVMGRNGMSYKRTTRHVRHKQDAERVQDRRRDLETLKRGPRPD
jgi:transposase